MPQHHKLLQIALVLFGVVFCLVYPLAMLWPSGWAWHEGPPAASEYFMMIVGVYATFGVFLIRAARDPAAHRSQIGRAVWRARVCQYVWMSVVDCSLKKKETKVKTRTET